MQETLTKYSSLEGYNYKNNLDLNNLKGTHHNPFDQNSGLILGPLSENTECCIHAFSPNDDVTHKLKLHHVDQPISLRQNTKNSYKTDTTKCIDTPVNIGNSKQLQNMGEFQNRLCHGADGFYIENFKNKCTSQLDQHKDKSAWIDLNNNRHNSIDDTKFDYLDDISHRIAYPPTQEQLDKLNNCVNPQATDCHQTVLDTQHHENIDLMKIPEVIRFLPDVHSTKIHLAVDNIHQDVSEVESELLTTSIKSSHGRLHKDNHYLDTATNDELCQESTFVRNLKSPYTELADDHKRDNDLADNETRGGDLEKPHDGSKLQDSRTEISSKHIHDIYDSFGKKTPNNNFEESDSATESDKTRHVHLFYDHTNNKNHAVDITTDGSASIRSVLQAALIRQFQDHILDKSRDVDKTRHDARVGESFVVAILPTKTKEHSYGPTDDCIHRHIRNDLVGENDVVDYVEMDAPHSINNSPRHPEYADRGNRLFSYTTWRYEHIQDPTRLANHGFFYTGQDDLVRCFYCSIGLKDFIKSDNALLEHVRYSGNCLFLLEHLGPKILAEYKERIRSETSSMLQAPPPAQAAAPDRPQNTIVTSVTGNTLEYKQPEYKQPEYRQPEYKQPEHKQPEYKQPEYKPVEDNYPRYRHPEYQSLDVRLSSFVGWSANLVQTPLLLATAGFYYTGTRDIVRCWACDGGLQQWDPTDDPWIEHCRWFPFCTFARQVKGEAYITQVKSYYQGREHQEKVTISVPELDTTAPANDDLQKPMMKISIDERTAHGNHTSKTASEVTNNVNDKPAWKSDDAITVLNMGFKEREVERAVRYLKTEKRSESVELLIETIEKLSKESEEGKADKLNAEDVLAEHRRLTSMVICNNCNTADINALFLPCQHHRFCFDCAKQMTRCSVCGQTINHVVKTYSA